MFVYVILFLCLLLTPCIGVLGLAPPAFGQASYGGGALKFYITDPDGCIAHVTTAVQWQLCIQDNTHAIYQCAAPIGGASSVYCDELDDWTLLNANALTDGDKGDISVSGDALVWDIDDGSITNAKMSLLTTARIKGRVTAGTGEVEDLTPTQVTAMLNPCAAALQGMVPPSDSNPAKFLNGNCQFAVPAGSGTVADPGGNGVMARTALNTTVPRTVTGTTGNLVVTNGDGVAGNPTLDVGSTVAQVDAANTFATGQQKITSAVSEATATEIGDGTDALKVWGESGILHVKSKVVQNFIWNADVVSNYEWQFGGVPYLRLDADGSGNFTLYGLASSGADFRDSSYFYFPVAAGATPVTSGSIRYDSTSNTLEAGFNGVNKTLARTDSNITGTSHGLDAASTVASYADMTEIAAPATPGAGLQRLYAKSSGAICGKNSSGTETCMGGGGGGGGDALVANPLSQFAATTSAQLATVLSDESGATGGFARIAGTLVVASGKTATVNNTLTLSGTDASTLNVGTGGTLGTAAYTAATAYEVPLTFSTGLTRTSNTVTVDPNYRRIVCMLHVGDGATTIVTADFSPFKVNRCYVPYAATIVEVTMQADAGTSSVLLERRRDAATLADLLSGALATAGTTEVCAMSSTSQTCFNGTTSSGSITLSNTTLNAGDWIEVKSGTVVSTPTAIDIAVVFTRN